ncbi:hypothetical protein DTO021C3_8827 [Paecilomyces variotii]|nr:hypothetical protein DTO021C3_8827 [Paecilomyces variotii]
MASDALWIQSRRLLARAALSIDLDELSLLRSQFGRREHTDAIIRTKHKDIYVHIRVLINCSGWFARVPTESDGTHAIYLMEPENPGDDRDIETMIRFMYGWEYRHHDDESLSMEDDTLDRGVWADAYRLDARMYILAQKYDFRNLLVVSRHLFDSSFEGWFYYTLVEELAQAGEHDRFYDDYKPEHTFYRRTIAYLARSFIKSDHVANEFRHAARFLNDLVGFLDPDKCAPVYHCVTCENNFRDQRPYCSDCREEAARASQTRDEQAEDSGQKLGEVEEIGDKDTNDKPFAKVPW